MKRALAFYRDVLGIEVLDENEHWSTLSLGGPRLGLHLAAKQDFLSNMEKRAGATITLSVDSIDESYKSYKAKGVKFIGEISRNPWGSMVSFVDPDGNVLDLKQAPSVK